VAVSLLLLVGAGLLLRSVQKLHAQDLGFSPERVVIFGLGHSAADRSPAAMTAVERAARARVLAIPGVESASFSGILIFSPGDIGAMFTIPGQPPPGAEPLRARYNSVSPGYFETLGMGIVAGRSIEERDDAVDVPAVTVVNESFARRFFPEGAVGRTILFGRGPAAKPMDIVGVVRDAKYNNLREAAKPMLFLPYAQMTRSLRALEVRTHQPAAAIAGPVREALSSVSKDIMIRQVIRLSDQVDSSLAAEQLLLRLCLVFGALALVLACVGLYGVIAYSVAQRTTEIGVRVALGATPLSIMRGVVNETLLLVVAGVALGIPAALAAGHLLVAFLYGLTPRDPSTIAAAAAVLFAAATIAAVVPALRAARVDPNVALRYE
jgi:predicted permease